MKTNRLIFMGLMFGAVAFTSCSDSWLEIEKPDGDNLDTYYNNETQINEALNAAYDPIHWHDWGLGQYNAYNICSDIMSDDFWVGGSNVDDMRHWHLLGNFVGNADNTLSTLWTIDYSGVKRCNDCLFYIENYAKGNLSDSFEKSTIAQARTLRVFFYNNLWHLFGNVPFYLENLGEPPYTAPQLTADQVYDRLVVELEEVLAEDNLPMKWDAVNAGRVSKAMAIMMYAEMVAYQNDESRFPKALSYLKEVINSGDYALFSDFKGYWDTDNEWNSESIWEINYDQTISERDWGSGTNIGGMVIPTLISPNGYGDSEWSNNDGWGFMPVRQGVKKLLQGDARLAGTVWDLTEAWETYTPTKDKLTLYTQRDADTHLWLQKYRPYTKNYMNGTSSPNLNYANNYRYYRYAETLLYAAEFALRTGDASTCKTYVDQIRQRAGINTATAYNINDIFTERHKEFVGEGKRYYDLVRAEGIAGVQSENKATGVLVPVNNADEGLLPTAYTRTNSWTPKKKYIPIAQAELDSDPNLVQNDY